MKCCSFPVNNWYLFYLFRLRNWKRTTFCIHNFEKVIILRCVSQFILLWKKCFLKPPIMVDVERLRSFYRPCTHVHVVRGKVMFLQVFVCPQGWGQGRQGDLGLWVPWPGDHTALRSPSPGRSGLGKRGGFYIHRDSGITLAYLHGTKLINYLLSFSKFSC